MNKTINNYTKEWMESIRNSSMGTDHGSIRYIPKNLSQTLNSGGEKTCLELIKPFKS